MIKEQHLGLFYEKETDNSSVNPLSLPKIIMAGIYIHIPFCKQKCHYCNFFSVASLKYRAKFLDALLIEIALQKEYLQKEEINTIYFGGGTPSMLSNEEIECIINELNKFHFIADDVEITLEANPDDLNFQKINDFSKSSINRLSIGVQSFLNKDLTFLNRVHNSEHALRAIKQSQDAGFKNISIDLIYGIPGLTKEKWNNNLQLFFDLEIPHLSAYSLTVEPKTALDVLIRKKKMPTVNETESIAHFEELMKQTQTHNFIHYEISNFSKEGFYSKHNSTYWLGGKYLGLGPSAHSYNGTSRQWNVSQISKYISLSEKNQIFEKEVLSDTQRFNEYVMTSLRTSWGCNLEQVKNNFGNSFYNHLNQSVSKHINEERIKLNKNVLYLTPLGKLYADGIAADLFMD